MLLGPVRGEFAPLFFGDLMAQFLELFPDGLVRRSPLLQLLNKGQHLALLLFGQRANAFLE